MTTLDDCIRVLRSAFPNNFEKRIRGASDSEICTLEERLGFALPEALDAWLRVCRGVSFDFLACLYGTDERDHLAIWQHMPEDWPNPHWIPIAGDGCGNYYCLLPPTSDAPRGAVGFVEGIGPESIDYVVASGLYEFLYSYIVAGDASTDWIDDKELLAQRDPALFKITTWPFIWTAD